MLLASTAVAQARRGIATLLVMPFENRSKVAGAEWLSEACSEVLTQRMGSPALYVVSRNQRVYSFDHAGVPVDVKPSRATIFRVAEQMGADFVVLGGYDVSGRDVSGERTIARGQEPEAASGDQTERQPGGFCCHCKLRWHGRFCRKCPIRRR